MANKESSGVSCPACGGEHILEAEFTDEFPFGDEGLILSAKIPLLTCQSCGFQYADERASRARHEAVCESQGLLTPTEVKAIRLNLGLSRPEFAKAYGIPPSSMERWENGKLIQNVSLDTLLRALENPVTANRIDRRVRRAGSDGGTVIHGRFPALESNEKLFEAAKEKELQFNLRSA